MQCALVKMYNHGTGIIQDYQRPYHWVSLAIFNWLENRDHLLAVKFLERVGFFNMMVTGDQQKAREMTHTCLKTDDKAAPKNTASLLTVIERDNMFCFSKKKPSLNENSKKM